MSDLFLPVILGTARPGRRSQRIAHAIVDMLERRGITTELIDVADVPLTATGRAAPSLERYRETAAAADGFVIVAPEYNHGYPGELKLLLDSEFAAYSRKPVGIVSVSSGLMGGARMAEQLKAVTTALRMIPVSPAVHVGRAAEALDDRGAFASSSLADVAERMLDELEWYAASLRTARTAA
jgi:NAD(P)H-dependent FMN reductase